MANLAANVYPGVAGWLAGTLLGQLSFVLPPCCLQESSKGGMLSFSPTPMTFSCMAGGGSSTGGGECGQQCSESGWHLA